MYSRSQTLYSPVTTVTRYVRNGRVYRGSGNETGYQESCLIEQWALEVHFVSFTRVTAAGLKTNQPHCEWHTARPQRLTSYVSLPMWRISACDVNGVATTSYLPEERLSQGSGGALSVSN